MTSNLSSDSSTIHTSWLDANHAEDPQGKNWNSNIIETDTYKKIN